jgi:hypothetical protein
MPETAILKRVDFQTRPFSKPGTIVQSAAAEVNAVFCVLTVS